MDDHPLMRRAVRLVIESEPCWNVAGEAASGRQAIAMAETLRPDVVVLDLSLPEGDGMQAIGAILQSSPGTRVLVLTMHDSEDLIEGVIRAGAAAYVLKSEMEEDLRSGIAALIDGQVHFSSPVARIVYKRICGAENSEARARLVEALSRREQEVLLLLSQGQSNRQVADHLHLSVRTVENHRARMMHKLGVHSLGALLHLAMRVRLVQA